MNGAVLVTVAISGCGFSCFASRLSHSTHRGVVDLRAMIFGHRLFLAEFRHGCIQHSQGCSYRAINRAATQCKTFPDLCLEQPPTIAERECAAIPQERVGFSICTAWEAIFTAPFNPSHSGFSGHFARLSFNIAVNNPLINLW